MVWNIFREFRALSIVMVGNSFVRILRNSNIQFSCRIFNHIHIKHIIILAYSTRRSTPRSRHSTRKTKPPPRGLSFFSWWLATSEPLLRGESSGDGRNRTAVQEVVVSRSTRFSLFGSLAK